MKGMIYRELLLRRKAAVVGFITLIVLNTMMILVRLSMECGNLVSHYGSLDRITFYIFVYAIPFAAYVPFNDNGALVSDYNCKWNILQYTMPIKEEKFALMKLGFSVAGIVFAVIWGTANALIMCGFSERPFTLSLFVDIVIVALAASIVSSLTSIILVKHRTQKAVNLRVVITITVVYLSVGLFGMSYIAGLQEKCTVNGEIDNAMLEAEFDRILSRLDWVPDAVRIAIPLLAIGAMILAWVKMVKYMKRREN